MIIASKFAIALRTCVPLTMVAWVLLASNVASQTAAEDRGEISVEPCFPGKMETEDNGAGGQRLLHGRLPLTMHAEDYSPWPTPDLAHCQSLLSTLRSQLPTLALNGMYTFENPAGDSWAKGWVHETCMFSSYIREIYVPAAKFQVNLARALDWFQVELERVQAGTSKFITTNNTILCSAGPAENKVINLAIFNDPRGNTIALVSTVPLRPCLPLFEYE